MIISLSWTDNSTMLLIEIMVSHTPDNEDDIDDDENDCDIIYTDKMKTNNGADEATDNNGVVAEDRMTD